MYDYVTFSTYKYKLETVPYNSFTASEWNMSMNPLLIYSDGPSCARIPSLTPTRTFQYSEMSLTHCAQLCKGVQLDTALLQNDTCNCVDSLPTNTEVSLLECSYLCPGNEFQLCGGPGDIYSVANGNIHDLGLKLSSEVASEVRKLWIMVNDLNIMNIILTCNITKPR